jgi:hypothetical protein
MPHAASLLGFRASNLSDKNAGELGISAYPTLPAALTLLRNCARYFIYQVPAELQDPVAVTPQQAASSSGAGDMDVGDDESYTSASASLSKPLTGLAATMAKARAKQEQATSGAGSGKATSAGSLQKRREEHLKKYLDDFEMQATAMLEKMGDVQDELTRKGVPITDGYEQL